MILAIAIISFGAALIMIITHIARLEEDIKDSQQELRDFVEYTFNRNRGLEKKIEALEGHLKLIYGPREIKR